MEKLKLNIQKINVAKNGIYFPQAKNWPQEFGLPEAIGELFVSLGNPDFTSTALNWLSENLEDGMDVMPAIHRFYHWRLVGKHDESALQLMQGMSNHPMHGNGKTLRKAIRDVAADRKAAATGEAGKGKILWQNYCQHFFVYGGGHNAAQPSNSAKILGDVCSLKLNIPHFHGDLIQTPGTDPWENYTPLTKKLLHLLCEESKNFRTRHQKAAA